MSKIIKDSHHPITEWQKVKTRKVSTFANKNSVLRPDWLGLNQSGDSCGVACWLHQSESVCVCVCAPGSIQPRSLQRLNASHMSTSRSIVAVPTPSISLMPRHEIQFQPIAGGGRRSHQLQSMDETTKPNLLVSPGASAAIQGGVSQSCGPPPPAPGLSPLRFHFSSNILIVQICSRPKERRSTRGTDARPQKN